MRSSRFVSVLIVGAFVLAACGGGDDTDAASPAAGAVPGAGIDAAQCAQVVTAMSAAAAAVPAAMSGGAGDLSTRSISSRRSRRRHPRRSAPTS